MLNRKQRETVELIEKRLNVKLRECKARSNGHVLCMFDAQGLQRPATCTLSGSPSDHRSQLNAVSDVRKQLLQAGIK